jgi:hypothetical protein
VKGIKNASGPPTNQHEREEGELRRVAVQRTARNKPASLSYDRTASIAEAPSRGDSGARLTLEPAVIEAIAAALAAWIGENLPEMLTAERRPASQRYVDAATVARLFGVERAWVYAHKDELGALRLGEGRRARLRFDLQQVTAALERRQEAGSRRAGRPAKYSARGPRVPRVDGTVELIRYEA